MIIKHIYIESFGSLQKKTLSFSGGLNIIEGENESGKTTVCAFIRFLFYGFAEAAYRVGGEAERYLAFCRDGRLSGHLECSVQTPDGDALSYRISRTQNAGEKTSTATVVTLPEETPVFENEVPGEIFFGVNAEVFSKTAFVRQATANAPTEPQTGEYDADDRLSLTDIEAVTGGAIDRILFTATESIDLTAATAYLAAKRAKLFDPETQSGSIHQLEKQRRAFASRLENRRKYSEEINALCASVADSETRLRAHEARNKELSTVYAQYQRYALLDDTADIDDLRLVAASADKRTGALAAAMFRGDYFPEDSFVEELQQCAADMHEAEEAERASNAQMKKLDFSTRRDNIKEDYLRRIEVDGGVEALTERLKKSRRAYRTALVFGIVFSVCAVFTCAAAAVMFWLRAQNAQYWLPICGIFALLSVSAFITLGNRTKKTERFLARYGCETDDEMDNILEEYQISEARFHRDCAERDSLRAAATAARLKYDESARAAARLLSRLLPDGTAPISAKSLNASTVETAADRIERTLYEMLRMQNQADGAREAILALAENADIQAETAEDALVQWADARAALCSVFGGKRAKDINIEPVVRELDFNMKADAALTSRAEKARKKLSDAGVILPQSITDSGDAAAWKSVAVATDQSDPRVLSHLISEIDEELRRQRQLYAALGLAIDALQTSSKRLRREIAPRLTAQANRLMQSLTDMEKESRMLALSEDGHLVWRSADKGEDLPLGYLSAGTQDITYLSLRMALLDMLFSKERPPLLFDEAFATLDDKRLSRMMALLQSDGAHQGTATQALVFTCHKRERAAAEHANLIVL